MSTPDIAAALERVRASLASPFSDGSREALAALATIEAHIERDNVAVRAKMVSNAHNLDAAIERREAAEADLLLAAQQNTRLSERLDRLEGALREIDALRDNKGQIGLPTALAIVRAALAEEPYADVPGAGQRGC